jgi:iron complex outermembrane recepter protein
VRSTTDAGSLLGKSASAVGLGVQRRTPIVTDPRILSSRVGRQNASGSYWFPARIDLDTQLSKLDSRIIDDIIVVKGPYSALYGPDFRFLDVALKESPRFENGYETHASTSLEYRTNGEQWHGRKTVEGGDQQWGYRIGYGHRTGSDYESGDGVEIPSSYKSRDWDVAIGFDLSEDSQLEFHYLRLDQTDVEFPGQAFDLDFLVTDGFEATWRLDDPGPMIDSLEVDTWINQTRLAGDTSRSGKVRQFPAFAFPPFDPLRADTNVEALSTGYRLLIESNCDASGKWTVGTDFRYLQQNLDERLNGTFGVNSFTDRNSPIPKSHWANPGLLMENERAFGERLTLNSGVRLDFVSTNVEETAAELGPIGGDTNPATLPDVLGSSNFDRDFMLASAFLTGQYKVDSNWNLVFGAGRAERAPSMTELYAAESFLFVLQNGLNSVTGDPLLKKEQLWQIDLGANCEYSRFRGSCNAFHAWIEDAITFENMGINLLPPAGQDQQTRLKYVNTDLVTMVGFDASAEYDYSDWLSTFATLSYVKADDHSRNGDFATEPFSGAGLPVVPSRRQNLARGSFGRVGNSTEPLPGIFPMESRLGLRLQEPSPQSQWGAELSVRVVDNQNRVASSLLESPTDGFTTWDLRTYWRPADNWLLIAGAENFTDKSYFEHLDFRSPSGSAVYQPGRNFYFSTEVTW